MLHGNIIIESFNLKSIECGNGEHCLCKCYMAISLSRVSTLKELSDEHCLCKCYMAISLSRVSTLKELSDEHCLCKCYMAISLSRVSTLKVLSGEHCLWNCYMSDNIVDAWGPEFKSSQVLQVNFDNS
jgi:hypothetical protein